MEAGNRRLDPSVFLSSIGKTERNGSRRSWSWLAPLPQRPQRATGRPGDKENSKRAQEFPPPAIFDIPHIAQEKARSGVDSAKDSQYS
jgi:hypothetical protein